MSVTFTVQGIKSDYEDDNFLNIANGNARDLFAHLGFDAAVDIYYGTVRACELKKRIADARAVKDKGRLGSVEARTGQATVIMGARRPERMTEYLDILEQLCGLAGDLGVIVWG